MTGRDPLHYRAILKSISTALCSPHQPRGGSHRRVICQHPTSPIVSVAKLIDIRPTNGCCKRRPSKELA